MHISESKELVQIELEYITFFEYVLQCESNYNPSTI